MGAVTSYKLKKIFSSTYTEYPIRQLTTCLQESLLSLFSLYSASLTKFQCASMKHKTSQSRLVLLLFTKFVSSLMMRQPGVRQSQERFVLLPPKLLTKLQENFQLLWISKEYAVPFQRLLAWIRL